MDGVARTWWMITFESPTPMRIGRLTHQFKVLKHAVEMKRDKAARAFSIAGEDLKVLKAATLIGLSDIPADGPVWIEVDEHARQTIYDQPEPFDASFEPSGDCPYMVENIYRVAPNQDWHDIWYIFYSPLNRLPIEVSEPDCTSPYMVENQRTVAPGDDWLRYGECVYPAEKPAAWGIGKVWADLMICVEMKLCFPDGSFLILPGGHGAFQWSAQYPAVPFGDWNKDRLPVDPITQQRIKEARERGFGDAARCGF